ncbi:sensor histidine kinase [Paraurantiacibacter namhicola]|uniref:histidine kinase n=1 Tax=Paraurantiacibacter namhicola TaxID=645517 RepID=A0A1C7D8J0_9SPHN|nr:ATP-binding protein [Paraurantiacibacter namhicola]ANU07672.1 sensory histidine kinase CreC [Paraurantiacibacter namhicola]
MLDEIQTLTFLAAALAAFSAFFSGYLILRTRKNTQFEIEEIRWLMRKIAADSANQQALSLPRSASVEDDPFDLQVRSYIHELTGLRNENARLSAKLYELLDQPSQNTARSLNDRDTHEQVQKDLARDINHALKTPLSRLDTASALLEANVLDPLEASQRINNATQLCYYYLNSFRSLSVDYSPGSDTDHLDFNESVRKAIRIYTSDSGKDLGLQLNVPVSVSAVADYYAIATLMPLIENAVEASPDGGEIKVTGKEVDGELRIEISNHFNETPPRNFEDRGVSSKPHKSNEGLGIAIVRAFLDPLLVGDLQFRVQKKEGILTVLVRMKAR